MEVFILGYPFEIKPPAYPVWKRGLYLAMRATSSKGEGPGVAAASGSTPTHIATTLYSTGLYGFMRKISWLVNTSTPADGKNQRSSEKVRLVFHSGQSKKVTPTDGLDVLSNGSPLSRCCTAIKPFARFAW
jgi:hypothetical protein